MKNVTVAAIQMKLNDAFSRSDVDENVSHALEMVDRAVGMGAEIVALPEFFNVGSWLENKRPDDVVESLYGPTYQRVIEKAKELSVWLIGGTIPARKGDKIYNAGLIISPDGEAVDFSRAWYYPGYYELEGKYPVVETEFGIIGCVICGDILLGEIPRMLKFRGAEIIFHPTLSNELSLQLFHEFAWVRAIENCYFIVQINPIAYHPKVGKLPGHSAIFSPFGDKIAEAPLEKEHILVARIDPNIRAKTWFGGKTLDEAKKFFDGSLKDAVRRISYNDVLASALKGDSKDI
ncbi:MAG: carbon-nitrogen hydrolase family protein [Candidatus Lokiarchaeia archaeon]